MIKLFQPWTTIFYLNFVKLSILQFFRFRNSPSIDDDSDDGSCSEQLQQPTKPTVRMQIVNNIISSRLIHEFHFNFHQFRIWKQFENFALAANFLCTRKIPIDFSLG